MKNKYCLLEQKLEQVLGDIGVKIRLSSPKDNKFSPKKHPKNL